MDFVPNDETDGLSYNLMDAQRLRNALFSVYAIEGIKENMVFIKKLLRPINKLLYNRTSAFLNSKCFDPTTNLVHPKITAQHNSGGNMLTVEGVLKVLKYY